MTARRSLTVAAAQTRSHYGDFDAAIAEHMELTTRASGQGATLVVFPELSLTGYEPDMIDLHGLHLDPADPALAPLRKLCSSLRVHVLAGAPIRPTGSDHHGLPADAFLHIDTAGAVRTIYRKRHMDLTEIGIFGAGTGGGAFAVDGIALALGLGADLRAETYLDAAAKAGARGCLVGSMYLIGSQERIEADMKAVTSRGMWGVLAQYTGGTGGGPACGGSGIWAPDGTVAARLGTEVGVAVATLSL